jgi:hypothetical protein
LPVGVVVIGVEMKIEEPVSVLEWEPKGGEVVIMSKSPVIRSQVAQVVKTKSEFYIFGVPYDQWKQTTVYHCIFSLPNVDSMEIEVEDV